MGWCLRLLFSWQGSKCPSDQHNTIDGKYQMHVRIVMIMKLYSACPHAAPVN